MADSPIPFTPVKNYRSLTQAEIDLMNEAVDLEERVMQFHDKLLALRGSDNKAERPHPRWMAIGKTKVELGFMALRRSIAKPGRDQREVLD